MDDELMDLAERIRRAAEAERGAHSVQAADRAVLLEEGRAARAALLEDLTAFGTALGVVEVDTADDAVSWSFDGRSVVFETSGLGDGMVVTWRELANRTGRLYRESQLRDKWVMTIEIGGREVEKVVFRNEGLLRLLDKGLRLPAPDDIPAVSEEPAAVQAPDAETEEEAPVGRPRRL